MRLFPPHAGQTIATKAEPARISRPPWLPGPSPLLGRLEQIVQNIIDVDESCLSRLTDQLKNGVAFGGRRDLAMQFSRLYFLLSKEVAPLICAASQLVLNLEEAATTRFGLATALVYSAIPRNIVPESVGDPYGYLDDWLILQAASLHFANRWFPSSLSLAELSQRSEFVCGGIDLARANTCTQVIQSIQRQRQALQFVQPGQLNEATAQILLRPVPQEWVPPSVPSTPSLVSGFSRGPGSQASNNANDLTTFHSSGAITSHSDGSMIMTFKGGGYAGVTSDGDIVSS